MDVMMRRRELIGMQSELPGTYRRVEWIGNAAGGRAYIDTGLNAGGGYTSQTVLAWDVVTGSRQLTGAQYVGYWGLNINGFYEAYTVSTQSAQIGQWDTVEFSVYSDGSKSHRNLAVNGNVILSDLTSSTAPGGKILLFNIEHVQYPSFAKIKACKIWKDNVLRRDFIPCVRKSNNKPGMYDTVSKTFFTNAGNGEFIVPN